MITLTTLDCCALQEVSGLGTCDSPHQALVQIAANWDPCAFVLFTEAGSGRYGAALARAIKERGLGDVAWSGGLRGKVNPNTGRKVRVYLWVVNARAWAEWKTKHDRSISLDTKYNP